MARVFAEAEPNGLNLQEIDLGIKAATEHLPVVEVTGRAGDIFLMHPFTVHASSSNTSDRARIAAVKLVRLYEKMDLNRRDTADYSPVELAIVNALGQNEKIC
jgi:ectoine hydroxylase-related dioxygenase (phytanoyl-CoA dioxygenase family)